MRSTPVIEIVELNSVVEDTLYVISTPIITNDHSQVLEDVSVRIPVLDNDFDFQSELMISSIDSVAGTGPFHGFIQLDTNSGVITYTPEEHFFGMDSFRYAVCNLTGICGEATVNVLVHPVNDPPRLLNDTDTVSEDGYVHIDVMLNDSDSIDHMKLDPNALNIQGTRLPNHGKIALDSLLHQIIYRPDPNYFGFDYFEYSLCDQGYPTPSLCDTASVWIKVTPVNDGPVLSNDLELTYAGLLAVVDVLQNDSDSIDEETDLDLATLTTDGLRISKHGITFVDQQVGMIIYVPQSDYVGMDTFAYRICDFGPEPILCDTALVVIEVLPSFENKSTLIRGPEIAVQSSPKASYVYPNPAENFIRIHTDTENWSKIEIFSTAGIMVFSNAINDVYELTRSIDIHSFPSGTYFLRLANALETKTIPFYKY
jgi:hypothetical protein